MAALMLPLTGRAATPASVGFIDARAYGATGNGVSDDTAALQAAINAGLAQNKPVFLAAGTYLVSDTLWCKVQGQNGCGGTVARAFQLAGSNAGARPVIKLSAGAAAGFNIANPSDAQLKPVIHIWLDNTTGTDNPLYNPSQDQESCLYRSGVRGVDFDISGNHPSAVAIRFPAAQDSFINDVKITAHGAFAGILGQPGRNAANVNIEIVGGRHGIYSKGLGLGAVFTGLRLTGQTDAALVTSIYRGVAITGLQIVSSAGVAPVRMLNIGNAYAGHLTITDASIELADNTPAAVDNAAGRFLSLTNAYVRGAATLVSGIPAAGQQAAHPTGWIRVADYAHTPALINGVTATNLIDGVLNTNAIKQTEPADGAPADLVSRHVWESMPSFEDADAYVITSPIGGGVDDSAAIQAALDAHAKVYLGSGTYTLNATLVIPSNRTLMGTPGYRSVLKPSSALVAAFPSPGRGWIVDTEDDAASTTRMMDFLIDSPSSKTSGLGALRWRAGRGLFHNINTYNSAARYYESHRHILEVTGSGGGRIYAYHDDHAIIENTTGNSPHNPDFRKVMVDGTRSPLTFYGLNLERGGDYENGQEQGPFCEIRGSSNVRVFGTKSESAGTIYRLVDSSNIQLHSVHVNENNANKAWLMEVVHLQNCSKLDFRNLYWPASASRLIVGGDANGGLVHRDKFLGVYRSGAFDPAPWEADANTGRPIDRLLGMSYPWGFDWYYYQPLLSYWSQGTHAWIYTRSGWMFLAHADAASLFTYSADRADWLYIPGAAPNYVYLYGAASWHYWTPAGEFLKI